MARQVGVERFENGRFLVMGREYLIILSEGGNFILPKPNGGRGLEVLGVLIPLDDGLYFATLFPEGIFLLDGPIKEIDDEQSKGKFKWEERAAFFNEVEPIDGKAAVDFALGSGFEFGRPGFELGMRQFNGFSERNVGGIRLVERRCDP